MNDTIQTILLLLGGVTIYVICYIISSKICSYIKKINVVRKKKLRWLITNGICLIFFLTYGLLDNYCGIRVVPLEALWFILTPISFFGLIWNTIAFFNSPRSP
jgi:hypothetical protein